MGKKLSDVLEKRGSCGYDGPCEFKDGPDCYFKGYCRDKGD